MIKPFLKSFLFNNITFYLFLVVSGIVWGFGQYPDFCYIRFFGLIPFLFIVFYRKNYLIESFIFGWIAYIVNFYWLYNTLHDTGRYPIIFSGLIPTVLCFYYALQYPLIAFIYKKILGLNKKIFFCSLPFIFVAVDFVFPKLFRHTIGDSLIGFFYFIQIIDIAGMSLIILIIMFSNLGIYKILEKFLNKQKLSLTNFIFILPVLIVFCYGIIRINYFNDISKKLSVTTASMIQGNITGKQKQDQNLFQTNINHYNDLTKRALNNYKPDFIIWSESVFNRSYDGTNETLKKFILDNYPPLILGIVVWQRDDITNSAILVNNRNQINRYDKRHLLIFGEYIPFEKTFPFLRRFTMLYKSERPGKTSSIFKIGNVNANISICFEDIFPEEIRIKNLEGSNLMVNITNDSWYGRGLGPLHHSILARLRAIENRRAFYRCTSTGLTTATDLTGKVIAVGNIGEAEFITAKLPLYDGRTIYSYIGETVSYFCIGIVIFLLIFIVAKRDCPKRRYSEQ